MLAQEQPHTALPLPIPAVKTPSSTPQHNSLPSEITRPTRPQLRIITSLPPPIIRPVPLRHPALIKSAPLCAEPTIPTPNIAPKTAHRDVALVSGARIVVKVFSPPAQPPGTPRSGHRRRLSIKIKALFSHLHIRTPRPSNQLEPEREVPGLTPDRPHRSPGTASFLVTRHAAPDTPHSAGSSSRFSMHSRHSRTRSDRLAVPVPRSVHSNGSSARGGSRNHLVSLGMDISHFSTPSTIRSSSTYGMLESGGSRSSARKTHSRGGSESSLQGRRGKRRRSMPDLRKMGSVW